MPENYTGIIHGKPFVPTSALDHMPGGSFVTDGVNAALLLNDDALPMKNVIRSEICSIGMSLHSEQILFPSELLCDANGDFKALLMPMPLSEVTLEQVLREPQKYFPAFDKSAAALLSHNIACCIATLHEYGTCCLELTPENLLVAPDGRIQLHYTALLNLDPYADYSQVLPSRDRDVTLMGEIIYQLLCGNAHPMYDTANRFISLSASDGVSGDVIRLMDDCFLRNMPHTAAQWCEALKKQKKNEPKPQPKPETKAEVKLEKKLSDSISDYEPDAILTDSTRVQMYTVKGLPGKFIKRYTEDELHKKGDSITKKLNFIYSHMDRYQACVRYCAFPEKLFFKDGAVIGYLSSLPENAVPLNRFSRENPSLYAAAANIADAVTSLSNCGIIPSTLSPDTVYLAPDGSVTLINCEQFRYTDNNGKVYPPYNFKPIPGYSAPEYLISPNNNTFSWEPSTVSFTLAELFWELFGNARLFSGTDAVKGLDKLPAHHFNRRIAELFERCFLYSNKEIITARADRPTAGEWKDAFTACGDQNILTQAVDYINKGADAVRNTLQKLKKNA